MKAVSAMLSFGDDLTLDDCETSIAETKARRSTDNNQLSQLDETAKDFCNAEKKVADLSERMLAEAGCRARSATGASRSNARPRVNGRAGAQRNSAFFLPCPSAFLLNRAA